MSAHTTHPSVTAPSRRDRDRTFPSERPSLLHRVTVTEARLAPTIARVGLGIVMFPHGAQKVLGWYGGAGFGGAYTFFVNNLHIPAPIAVFTILVELLASIALVLGLLTRVAAAAVIGIMITAIAMVHVPFGFFMNWYGAKNGEGFEYHLLAIALGLVCVVAGGGRGSIDRLVSAPSFERRP